MTLKFAAATSLPCCWRQALWSPCRRRCRRLGRHQAQALRRSRPALLRHRRSERVLPAGTAHPHLREQALLARWRYRGPAGRPQVPGLCLPIGRRLPIVRARKRQSPDRSPAAQHADRSGRLSDEIPAVLSGVSEREVGKGRACARAHHLSKTPSSVGTRRLSSVRALRGPVGFARPSELCSRVVALTELLDRLGSKIVQPLENHLIRPIPPRDATQPVPRRRPANACGLVVPARRRRWCRARRSRLTTAPAAMTAPSPTMTLGRMIAPWPIQNRSRSSPWSARRSAKKSRSRVADAS